MKKNKISIYIFLSAIGLVIVGIGMILLIFLPETKGTLKVLPYVCIGVGSGIFGGNIGVVVKYKNPQDAKQIEIEANDERNRAISNKAKARAYDLMIYVYAGILLAFTLMGVEKYILLTLAAVYLFFVFTQVYYLSKYHKEM